MKKQSNEQEDRTKTQEDVNGNPAAEEKEKEPQTYQLNTGSLPAIIMLAGGALASIITFINHYTLTEVLKIVLLSMFVFYILGIGIKKIFDTFHMPVKKKPEEEKEGEVIEKESETAPQTERSEDTEDK